MTSLGSLIFSTLGFIHITVHEISLVVCNLATLFYNFINYLTDLSYNHNWIQLRDILARDVFIDTAGGSGETICAYHPTQLS